MNMADSERLAAMLEGRGLKRAENIRDADYIVINTCMVRQSAENRIYGLVNNLGRQRAAMKKPQKIVLTGCLVGVALGDRTGKMLKLFKKRMPAVDEFLPIQEVGFDYVPKRSHRRHAWVPISNGCNNFCSYCVVPYARGREISRPFADILRECRILKKQGYQEVTLLGQNVNSYGNDLMKDPKFQAPNSKQIQDTNDQDPKHKESCKHLNLDCLELVGNYDLGFEISHVFTLFPYLLKAVAELGFERVNFISSNPWDFSEELIEVIAGNANISRQIHLPVQSGDNQILKRMNRPYTREEYVKLIERIRQRIPGVCFSTDIIVGFPGETEQAFQNTVNLCQQVGFKKAYIAMYSPRPLTAASRLYKDDVPHLEKRRRWRVLEQLINRK